MKSQIEAAIAAATSPDRKTLSAILNLAKNAYSELFDADAAVSAIQELQDGTHPCYVRTPAQLLLRVLSDMVYHPAKYLWNTRGIDRSSDDKIRRFVVTLALAGLVDPTPNRTLSGHPVPKSLKIKIGRFDLFGVRGAHYLKRAGFMRQGFSAAPSQRTANDFGWVNWSLPVYTHHGWVQCDSLQDILTVDEWYNLRHNARRPAYLEDTLSVSPSGKRFAVSRVINPFTGKPIHEETCRLTGSETGRAFAENEQRARKYLKDARTGFFLMPGYRVAGRDDIACTPKAICAYEDTRIINAMVKAAGAPRRAA